MEGKKSGRAGAERAGVEGGLSIFYGCSAKFTCPLLNKFRCSWDIV